MRDTNRFYIAWAVFVVNAVLCLIFFDPRTYDTDAILGLWQFKNSIFHLGEQWTISDQVLIRVVTLAITSAEILVLAFLNIGSLREINTYLIWPYSAYLATKIRTEFFFYPFCLIQTNLPKNKEIAVDLVIAFFTIILGENNGVIILFYRILCVIYARSLKLALLFTFLGCSLVYYINSHFDKLYVYLSMLKRFEYTRNIVDPNYSFLKTLAVFFSSMHTTAFVQEDYVIDAWFSLFFVLLFIWIWLKSGLPPIRHKLLAFFSSLYTFTALTHAFQNARYYYFYVSIAAEVFYEKYFYWMVALSVVHIVISGALHHSFGPGLKFERVP